MRRTEPPLRWHRIIGERKRHLLTACGRRMLRIERHEASDDTPGERERCLPCYRSTA